MKTSVIIDDRTCSTDLSQPIDISIPIKGGLPNLTAWGMPPPSITPVKIGDWEGSVEKGATINFNDIHFNPHAHGTHTECIGHITRQSHSIDHLLKTFFFLAELITITPVSSGEDSFITLEQVKNALREKSPQAVVIRTLPNGEDKKHRNYTSTNPPFVMVEAVDFLRLRGILHLLVDLPSIDKEEDGGKLLAHKAFWDVDGIPRVDATLTELVFVPSSVDDGSYLLNLQIAPFQNDATPSKPVLYEITE